MTDISDYYSILQFSKHGHICNLNFQLKQHKEEVKVDQETGQKGWVVTWLMFGPGFIIW